jgi:hypothetical protein
MVLDAFFTARSTSRVRIPAPLDARPHGWITVYIFFHGTSKDTVAKPRRDRGALPESAKPRRRSPASGSGGLSWRDG